MAVIDRRPHPGGAPVASTGIPTKTLRETALYVTGFRNRDVYGLSLELDREAVLEHLMSRKSEVRRTMERAVEDNLRRHGIRYIQGEASLGPDRTVRVALDDGERLAAGGDHPHRLGVPSVPPSEVPFDDPDVHDSEEILEIPELPARMAVIGGGPVACEYASIFTALGTDVTLIDAADRLLPFMDEEISRLLAEIFERMGMRLVLEPGWRRSSDRTMASGCASRTGKSSTPSRCCSRPGDRATPRDSASWSAARSSTLEVGSRWTSTSRPPRRGSTRRGT